MILCCKCYSHMAVVVMLSIWYMLVVPFTYVWLAFRSIPVNGIDDSVFVVRGFLISFLVVDNDVMYMFQSPSLLLIWRSTFRKLRSCWHYMSCLVFRLVVSTSIERSLPDATSIEEHFLADVLWTLYDARHRSLVIVSALRYAWRSVHDTSVGFGAFTIWQ